MKIRIVFTTEPREEYTVKADNYKIVDGVLRTWDQFTYGQPFNQQFFPLQNILYWAVVEQ